MARVTIPDEDRSFTDPADIAAFLRTFGITYEKWVVENRVSTQASDDEVLEAYAPEIERLKQEHGFVTADVINVTSETPGLDAMLEKFNKEHTHSEDEVRFTVMGRGLFHIHPEHGPVFAVQVESGDLMSVPRGTRHWFDLCEDKTIRCIRLFQDKSGWTPHYVEAGVHGSYAPLCMGPSYFAKKGTIAPAVDV